MVPNSSAEPCRAIESNEPGASDFILLDCRRFLHRRKGENAEAMSQLQKELDRRRTFAIISHPDAGKTTLTEKLLLFSGAIQMAGAVKAKKAVRHATSDWMKLEQERGISITSSVM